MKPTVALVLLTSVGHALAWESQCAVEPPGHNRSLSPAFDHICETDGLATCAEGYQAARGAYLGEHALITSQAMALAGIPNFISDYPKPFVYFVDVAPSLQPGGPAQTLEPACPGAMRLEVNGPGGSGGPRRPFAVWEFSQVPDYSYSISDWAMGNEHCPVTRHLQYSSAAIEACHTFRSHSSVVNSSHFVPQSRAIYRRYHQLALDTMDRCKAMHSARSAGQVLEGAAHHRRWNHLLLACEYEALAFQATASHYLEDAWSAGHMWQRWGSPVFPTPREYVVNHLVGAYSGTIHGMRGPILEKAQGFGAPQLGNLSAVHDQMCLPGPQDIHSRYLTPAGQVTATTRTADPTEWTYPRDRVPTGTDLSLRWGAGDTYLEACTASSGIKHLDVGLASNTELAFHYKRMMTCVAHGFAEVYDRGPHVASQFGARLDPSLDDKILPFPQPGGIASGSLSQLCWEQRVTNRTFLEGSRVGDTEGSLFTPGIIGFGVHKFVKSLAVFAPSVDGGSDDVASQRIVDLHKESQSDLVRAEAIRMGTWIAYRASRAPNGTDLANLGSLPMKSFAGVKRNEDHLSYYAADIADGGIPHFERDLRLRWQPEPSTLQCSTDADCQAQDTHSYCDRWAGVDNAGLPFARCSHLEAPVVRLFRDGEAAYFCGGDKHRDIEAAREACKGKPASSPECRACVQVIGPKLRNACDPGMQGGLSNPEFPHPRSICDALQDGGVAGAAREPGVNWPFERIATESWDDASERAVIEACQAGAQGTAAATPPLDYRYQSTPPSGASAVTFANGSFTENGGLCGRSQGGVQWYRWRSSGDYNRTWRFEVTSTATSYFGVPQPVTRLKLEMFNGPRCDPTLDLRATATEIDSDMDGGVDTLLIPWSVADTGPDEICLRLSPRDGMVRTGYQLVRRF